MNEDHQKEAATHQVEGARFCGTFAEIQQAVAKGARYFRNNWGDASDPMFTVVDEDGKEEPCSP